MRIEDDDSGTTVETTCGQDDGAGERPRTIDCPSNIGADEGDYMPNEGTPKNKKIRPP